VSAGGAGAETFTGWPGEILPVGASPATSICRLRT